MKKVLLLLAGILFSGMMFAAEGDDINNPKIVDKLADASGEKFVFNKDDGKFYAYNNLNQYEEWGVYGKVNNLTVAPATDGPVGFIASSDRASYFNTGYTPGTNTRVVAEIINPTPFYGDWQSVFGTAADGGHWFTYEYDAGYGNGDMRIGSKCYGSDNRKVGTAAFKQRRNIVELNAATGKMTIFAEDGTSILEQRMGEVVTDAQKATCPLFIFAEDFNNGARDFCREVKLFGLKIYEGATLLHDYVPYVQGGVVGLWDNVESAFLAPEGTGIYSGCVTAYEGKIVRYDKDNSEYKYTAGAWTKVGAMTMSEIANTDYKDLNNWQTNEGHKAIFADGKIVYTAGVNDIPSYKGTGGYEPLMTKVPVEVGGDYNFSFNFTNYSDGNAYGFGNWQPRAAVWKDWNLDTNEHFAFNDPNANLSYFPVTDAPISMDFIPAQAEMTLVLQFGYYNDGTEFKFKFSNLKVAKYVYPEPYPNPSLEEAIQALIDEADAFDSSKTTEALYTALMNARNNAADKKTADFLTQKGVFDALQEALAIAKAIDVTILKQTIALAQDEGKVAADNEWLVNAVNFLVNGTTSTAYNEALTALRNARRLAAMQRDEHNYPGQTPAAGKFYLYNVGQKAFLTNGSCWGTHAALGYPGNEMTLTAKDAGYTLMSEELTTSGKYLFPVAQDGIAKTFMDGTAANASTCVFEDAGDGSYYIKIGSEYLCFDGATTTQWGLSNRFNAVSRLAAANGDNAKWKLVTKEERLALLDGATADNPVDASLYITNPSLNRYISGWTGIALAGGRDQDGITEIWNKGTAEHDLYQVITVPKAGVYELKVQAYYRHGSPENHWAAYKAGTLPENYAVLYAGQVGEDVYETVPVRYVHEAAGKCPGEGYDETEEGSMPNQRYDDQPFFGNGYYWNTVRITIPTDNYQLRIGIFKDATWEWPAGQSRVDADNFRLTYYGPSAVEFDEKIDNAAAIAAADGNTIDVNLTRTVVADTWNTIVLPFDLTQAQIEEIFGEGSKVAGINAPETDEEAIAFKTTDAGTVAGKSYLLWPTKEVTDVIEIAGVTINNAALAEDAVGGDMDYVFTGIYDRVAPTKYDYFVAANNELKKNADTSKKLKAFRAYFKDTRTHLPVGDDGIDDPGDILAKRFTVDGQGTGIIFQNGDVETLGNIYTVSGQKADKLQKGVYVVNGKKVVVK